MGEAQALFERFARLRSRFERMTDAGRLDLADDAERLARDVRLFLGLGPSTDVVSVIRSIGEQASAVANFARARV